MFEHADEALQELAHKPADGQIGQSYLDAQRHLRQQHRDIQVNFFRILRQGTTAALAPPPGPEPIQPPRVEPDSQELSLPQDAELEESLAIGNLITKAEARYRPELLEMRLHLARLLERARLPERSNPYGPFAICESFRRSLVLAHELEPPIRLVVYKLFDRHLMDRLADFYRGCVDLAVADGHVPGSGFVHLLRRGGQTAAAVPISPASKVSVHQAATLTFEALRGLLDTRRPGASEPAPREVLVSTADLLSVLGELGAKTLSQEAIIGDALRSELSDALSALGTGAAVLAREDQDALDLVFLFFEHLLHGYDLPASIEALLARLQMPVAKVALLDKTFFSDQGHPARRLLNRIGQAAIGWSEDEDRGSESLFGMIERVVEHLVLDCDGSTVLFTQMDRFLAAFIAREESSSRSLEARVVPKLGPPTPESEKQMIANLVEEYLARYPTVPPVVESILREGWQAAMLATYRRSGTEGSAWRRGLDLADLLLWSVQPKLDAEERRQLLRRIPEILRGLRAQLSGGGSDQRQLARWFKDLQTLHLAALQVEAAAPRTATPDPAGGGAGSPLAVGSWVELRRDDGVPGRFKVAWVSPEGPRYLFVDRRGRRGPELGDRELRDLLEGGLARVLRDGQEPIADRAFRSVLARLAG